MSERWCGQGNHFTKLERFKRKSNGRPGRDCMGCEAKRRESAAGLAKVIATVVDGVDIDAIHRNPRFARKAAR